MARRGGRKIKRKFLPGRIRWFHESKIYHPELLQMENMYLSGYFACEKYYADILYDLREKIQFPVNDHPKNIKMAQEMQERESVSVHLRRGDYLDEKIPPCLEIFVRMLITARR